MCEVVWRAYSEGKFALVLRESCLYGRPVDQARRAVAMSSASPATVYAPRFISLFDAPGVPDHTFAVGGGIDSDHRVLDDIPGTAVSAVHPSQDGVLRTLALNSTNRPAKNVDSSPAVSLIARVSPKPRGAEVASTIAGAPMRKRLPTRLLFVEYPYVKVLDPAF